MRLTAAKTNDPEILKNRITVTDPELACLLGCGLTTARKIAELAGAAVKVGNRKVNSVEKVMGYIVKSAGAE